MCRRGIDRIHAARQMGRLGLGSTEVPDEC
jgi:hypothetical protein